MKVLVRCLRNRTGTHVIRKKKLIRALDEIWEQLKIVQVHIYAF